MKQLLLKGDFGAQKKVRLFDSLKKCQNIVFFTKVEMRSVSVKSLKKCLFFSFSRLKKWHFFKSPNTAEIILDKKLGNFTFFLIFVFSRWQEQSGNIIFCKNIKYHSAEGSSHFLCSKFENFNFFHRSTKPPMQRLVPGRAGSPKIVFWAFLPEADFYIYKPKILARV